MVHLRFRLSSGRALDPISRVTEVLFGLIMVLTFTGALSVADAGRDDVNAMLVGALGCNIAWGVIDAILYLMDVDAERNGGLKTLRAVRKAPNAAQAQRLIAEALPPVVAGALQPDDLDAVRLRILALRPPPAHLRLTWDDGRAAAGVFLLVVLAMLPVAFPFMVMPHVEPAMRVSNLIAITMLFVAGFAFGKIAGRRPVWTGLAMVLLGIVLVGMTIALGG